MHLNQGRETAEVLGRGPGMETKGTTGSAETLRGSEGAILAGNGGERTFTETIDVES